MSDINKQISDELVRLDSIMKAYNRKWDTPSISVTALKSYSTDDHKIAWHVACYDVKIDASASTLQDAVGKFIGMLAVQLGTPMEAVYQPALPAPAVTTDQDATIAEFEADDQVPF